ncbi:MAG: AraC family transcriptional regulator [bacterium]|nr:AraC family transcriptional regulator [bacterium]
MLDDANKPISAPVFNAPVECPVKINFNQGTYAFSGSLAYHQEMEIQYIRKGQGAYFIRDRSYPFHTNSLLVVRPGEIHRLELVPSAYIEKYSFCFAADFLGDHSCLADLPEDSPRLLELTEREAAAAEVIIRNIIEEKEGGQPYWMEIIYSELLRLILLIRRAALRREPLRRENPLINDVMRYIDSNFKQELTLSRLSDCFAVSPSYLSRLFKRCSGLNFKQYLTQRRIAEAKRLLEDDPERKISTIAREVGLPDFALLNRSFKMVTGLTPSEYRKLSSGRMK